MATILRAMRAAETEMLRAADGERHLAQSPPRVLALGDAEGRGAEGRGKRAQAGVQARACHRRRHHGRRHRRLVRVCGMQASLQDLDEAQLQKALARAKSLFKKQLARQGCDRRRPWRGSIADPEGKHIKHADVVIEAIVEKLEVKQKLFAELEAKLKPGAVLATNTSSLEARGHRRGAEGPRPPRRAAFLQSGGAACRWSRWCAARRRARKRCAKAPPSSPPSRSCR